MNKRPRPTITNPLTLLERMFPSHGMDSTEPQPRQSRLYLIACARHAWERLPGVCRAVVTLAERVYGRRAIDNTLHEQVYPHAENLTHCRGEAEDVNAIGRALVELGLAAEAEVWTETDIAPEAWLGFAHLAYFPFSRLLPYYRHIPVELHSTHFIHEIFGNPFRRALPLDSRWQTDTVIQLAQEAEETCNFSLLPILADALQDAGCDRVDVLDHLRHGGPHARGCWALELVLHVK